MTMTTTTRIHITISAPQADFLRHEAERRGITVSELIRFIVEQYREGRDR